MPLPTETQTGAEIASSSLPEETSPAALSGALVSVGMTSTVGVLLDEIPSADRARLAKILLAKPKIFWIDRAIAQIRLTSHRLNFGSTGPKKQLPLPPEKFWTIELQRAPRRQTIDGHDLVTVKYGFSSTILTDSASPGISEPQLRDIGGEWNEPFIFPVDPELVFQRTGFACLNESQFPQNSVDAEEVDLFYNQRCGVEKTLSNIGCHQTEMPIMSCPEALSSSIGKVESTMRFEHVPWDQTIADSVRFGEITNPDGPDLQPSREEFLHHRVSYRYIPRDSCTLVEQCVGAPGWRKLLQFPTGDVNVGAQPLEIGTVDYFLQGHDTILSKHGVFEFSACHQHYHFSHYGSFTLGAQSDAIAHKNGFCLQPSSRVWNNERSPLHHEYVDCIDQGVSVGWLDEYKIGLECQWIDVSDVPPNQDLPLSFTSNPDGLLCEGKRTLDEDGNQLFEPSPFKTTDGGPVDRPQCEQYSAWSANNTESYPVRIPEKGESYVTDSCRDGLFGPLRNCGLRSRKGIDECKPGTIVTLTCSVPKGSQKHVVRICEGSRALQTGIPCTFNDALGSGIADVRGADIRFTCPPPRDEVETGGAYSYLTGPLIPGEKAAEVTCVVKK